MSPPMNDYQSPRYDYESESDQYMRSGSTGKHRSVKMDKAPARNGRSRRHRSKRGSSVPGIHNRCWQRN